MTPQEQQLLQDLTARINQTTLPDKDPEAEQYLTQSLGRNPDALYILAQTVLVQKYALDQAKQQLDAAKQQAQQPQKHTSFLGSIFGSDDPKPAPPPPSQAQYAPVQNTGYNQPQYAQPGYAQPGYGAPPPSGPFGGMGGGGGFLRTAATTAAGVAAGALAFEGIESLMHGFGNHAGYGQNFGGFEGQPREEIVNNYYGDSDRQGGDLSDRFAAAGDSSSNDIEDRRDDSSDSNNFLDNDSSGDDFADTGDDSGADFSSDDNS